MPHLRAKSDLLQAWAVLLLMLLSENIWRCFGLTCYKDSFEQCFQDCPGCQYFVASCCCCGVKKAYDEKMYCVDGEYYCPDCLVKEYSKEGKNLRYEFLKEMENEYKEFVLEYFEDCEVYDDE